MTIGKFTINVGSMFSGKTTELLRQGKRYEFAGKRAVFFKPAADLRYSEAEIASHDDNKITAYVVNGLSTQIVFTVQDLEPPVDAVLIDELQLFDDSIISVIDHLLRMGINVHASGLDMDRYGKPFGSVPYLMAIADVVNKLHAICSKCGDDAWISHAKFHDKLDSQVVVGGADLYEPLCRACYEKANR